MRKKLICILAGLTVAVGLVGCGQKKAVEETTVATSETGSESSTVLKGTASKNSTSSDGADTTLTITAGGSQVMLDEVLCVYSPGDLRNLLSYKEQGNRLGLKNGWRCDLGTGCQKPCA